MVGRWVGQSAFGLLVRRGLSVGLLAWFWLPVARVFIVRRKTASSIFFILTFLVGPELYKYRYSGRSTFFARVLISKDMPSPMQAISIDCRIRALS